jgi:hypothetical protein
MNKTLLSHLLSIITKLLRRNEQDISEIMKEAEKEFTEVQNVSALQTSELNIRLAFIEILTNKIDISSVYGNENFLSVLFEGLPIAKIGDTIKHNNMKCKIISRKLTKNGGIEFILQNDKRDIFSHVFYD